jgi:hypothetical protein
MTNTVVEILESQGVKLKQVGDSMYRCNCPFHQDPTASFTAYSNTDSFYCFGCHLGGGAVQLLKLYKLPIPKELYERTDDPIRDAESDSVIKELLMKQLQGTQVKKVQMYPDIIRIRKLRKFGRHQKWLSRIAMDIIKKECTVENNTHSGHTR